MGFDIKYADRCIYSDGLDFINQFLQVCHVELVKGKIVDKEHFHQSTEL